MASWSEFRDAAPAIAAEGERLLHRDGVGAGLLATVRRAEPPRIHPVNVGIVDGGLYTFILRSAKRTDLEKDGRYALHTHQDPTAPSEFSIRGRARRVDDPVARSAVAAGWSFDVDDGYGLFELSLESAVLGVRNDADEWPPRYTSWAA